MTSARVCLAALGGLCIFALPASAIVGANRPGVRTFAAQGGSAYSITVLGARDPIVERRSDIERFIVQFRALPVVLATRRGADPRAARAASDRFTSDFARLTARARGGATAAIRRRFETCFDGAAIACSPEVVTAIRGLPYVVAVFPDDSVHALDDGNVERIGAPDVWARYGATGQGILVAIIDTGIDYDHPALGGGFGPGYRVVAGHDFVNDDDDPQDDVGHGTHVAGIVGANGAGLRGVAPDVHFHAYKVLGPGGGLQSDVIAGVERAVDPDQNPLTDDAVDVMNLSLGGPGDADNPLSQAVDAATAAGVVVSVAAGNEPSWYSMGAPASARQAITVGAVDESDYLAWFTSPGPAPGSFAVKPDVMAPGVGIKSSFPGGGTAIFDGTSMAAPHVAGAAALIRQIHTDWSPAQVKAALMNTAVDLRLPSFMQGAGRISVSAAVDAPFLVTPPSLSIGRLPALTGVTVLRESLHVASMRAATQQIQLSLGGPSPRGFEVTTPPSVTVPPMGTVTFAVEFTIDPEQLPALADPWTIDGAILARNGATTCVIPYGLARVNRVAIDAADAGLDFVFLHDRNGYGAFAFPAATGLAAYVGPGDYDVVAHYWHTQFGDPNACIVRDVDARRDTAIALARSDATNLLTWRALEHDGAELVPAMGMLVFLHESGSGFGLLGPVDRFAVSAPSGYRIDWGVMSEDPGHSVHLVSATRQGPFLTEVLSNRPEDYQRARMVFDLPPDANTAVNWLEGNLGWHGIWVGMGRELPIAGGRMTEDLYMTPWPRPEPFVAGVNKSIAVNRDANYSETVVATPTLAASERGEFRAHYLWQEVLRASTNELIYRSGMAPLVWTGELSLYGDSLVVRSSIAGRPRLLLSRLGDIHPDADATYRLFRDGALAQEGTLRASGSVYPPGQAYSLYAPPGSYRVEFETPEYEVGGARGRALASYSFALPSSVGLSPPIITSLQFLAGGAPTDSLDFTPTLSEMRVSLSGPMDSAAVEIAAHPGDAWQPVASRVEVEPEPATFVVTAALPGWLRGIYSARIRTWSGSGDLTYTMTPAFVAGGRGLNPVTTPAPSIALHGARPLPANGELRVEFALPSDEPAQLELFDVAGRLRRRLEVGYLGAGVHVVPLGESLALRPGMYWIRLRQAGRVLTAKAPVLR